MPVGRAEDTEAEPAPPPPKVRRFYSERTTLYDPQTGPSQPPAKSNMRVPLTPAPSGSSMDALLQDRGPAPLPATLPSPNQSAPAREEDRKIKSWARPEENAESRSSGWGWLADDLMRTLQMTSSETRVQSKEDESQDPFASPSAEERETRPDEREDGQPAAEARPVDGQSSAMTEEELVRAKLNEVSSSTAPEGWRPIGLEANDRGWSPAGEAAGDRDHYAAEEAGRNRSAYEAPSLDDPTRRWSAPGDNLSRSLAIQEAPAGERNRVLFPTASESALRSVAGSSSLFDRPSSGNGAANPDFSSPTPVFGSMSAVDLQPSLGLGSSLTPALSLPSQSASTPSLGVMGSELEARPKTLPW